jgi:hypothetical protein
MNPSEISTCRLIERALSQSPAFRQIDDRLYIVKQGSGFVMINVLSWGEDRAVVRCVAQLVKGVDLAPGLGRPPRARKAHLRIGAFSFVPEDGLILFAHSILGGPALDEAALLAAVRDVALVADEYDDRIARHFGGQTMQELLEEHALTRLLGRDPDGYEFKN